MTDISMPPQWKELSAAYSRYELMHRAKEIASIRPENFYKIIDVQGLEDFIRDLNLQEPDNYVGLILFNGEVEAVKEFATKFLSVAESTDRVPMDRINNVIRDAKSMIALLSEHGDIEIENGY